MTDTLIAWLKKTIERAYDTEYDKGWHDAFEAVLEQVEDCSSEITSSTLIGSLEALKSHYRADGCAVIEDCIWVARRHFEEPSNDPKVTYAAGFDEGAAWQRNRKTVVCSEIRLLTTDSEVALAHYRSLKLDERTPITDVLHELAEALYATTKREAQPPEIPLNVIEAVAVLNNIRHSDNASHRFVPDATNEAIDRALESVGMPDCYYHKIDGIAKRRPSEMLDKNAMLALIGDALVLELDHDPNDIAYSVFQAIEPYLRSPTRESVAVKCEGCNGHGMVGNMLNSETCPFCDGSGEETDAAARGVWSAVYFLLRQMKQVVGPNKTVMWESPDGQGGQFADKAVALLCWLNRIPNVNSIEDGSQNG